MLAVTMHLVLFLFTFGTTTFSRMTFSITKLVIVLTAITECRGALHLNVLSCFFVYCKTAQFGCHFDRMWIALTNDLGIATSHHWRRMRRSLKPKTTNLRFWSMTQAGLLTNRCRCYKTFYGRSLRIVVISSSVCPWQALPVPRHSA